MRRDDSLNTDAVGVSRNVMIAMSLTCLVAGCSSGSEDNGKTCGPGTVERDGVCIAANPLDTGDTSGSETSRDVTDSSHTYEPGEIREVEEMGDSVDGDASRDCKPLPDPPGNNVVNLGNKGLKLGDPIGSTLEKWFKDGNEVRIPAGEYEWTNRLQLVGVANASIVGMGDVVFRRPDGATHGINFHGAGDIEMRNITLRGTTEHRTLHLSTSSPDAKVVVRNIEIPDGGRRANGKNPVGTFVAKGHVGENWLYDMLIQGFPNNGLYASAPGISGGGGNGSVHVIRGLYKNNNIAGVRIGSDGSSVQGTVVVQKSSKGGNHRGVWLRETASNMRVENVHIVQRLGAVPFLATPQERGGSASVRNLYIRNETGKEAMQIKRDIDLTGTNIHITGSGSHDVVNTTSANLGTICRGSGCTEPRTTKPERCR